MANKATKGAVPKSMQVQLARLFGGESKEARQAQRNAKEWKATLRKVLHELDRYIQDNVDTDELHAMMIASGLFAADESLKDDDFWPGYAEGLTRVILTLLGDYPDHRRRRGGAKGADYYSLSLLRGLHYPQSTEQRFRTLLAAGVVGLPGLKTPPRGCAHGVPQAFRVETDARSVCSVVQKAVSRSVHGRVFISASAWNRCPLPTISEVTRRSAFDFLANSGVSWSGRLAEDEFLSRLYDLTRLLSDDGRYRDASGDIFRPTHVGAPSAARRARHGAGR